MRLLLGVPLQVYISSGTPISPVSVRSVSAGGFLPGVLDYSTPHVIYPDIHIDRKLFPQSSRYSTRVDSIFPLPVFLTDKPRGGSRTRVVRVTTSADRCAATLGRGGRPGISVLSGYVSLCGRCVLCHVLFCRTFAGARPVRGSGSRARRRRSPLRATCGRGPLYAAKTCVGAACAYCMCFPRPSVLGESPRLSMPAVCWLLGRRLRPSWPDGSAGLHDRPPQLEEGVVQAADPARVRTQSA